MLLTSITSTKLVAGSSKNGTYLLLLLRRVSIARDENTKTWILNSWGSSQLGGQ